MKRMLTVLVAVLLLGLSNYGLAQETEETPTSVTIGLKTWYATWEYKPVGAEGWDFGTGVMYGPALNIRSGNLFVGFSYLTGGGFTDEYTESGYIYTYPDYWGNYDYEWGEEFDRTDMDLSIGYYVTPNLGVFLGYKTLTIGVTETYTLTTEYSGSATGEDSWENEFSGFALGVTGHTRIGESRMILFGTLSYVSLASEFDGEAGEDFMGPAIEVGLAYALETMPLSFTVGYKYQSYEEDVEDGGKDVFAGL
ncbi:hypothetical protein E3J95_03590, partial [Candidatus Aerophobetes bacterium]